MQTDISRNWNLFHFLYSAVAKHAYNNSRFKRISSNQLKPGDRIWIIENYKLVFKCVCGEFSHDKEFSCETLFGTYYRTVKVFKDTDGNLIDFSDTMYVEQYTGSEHSNIPDQTVLIRVLKLVTRIGSSMYTPRAKENWRLELERLLGCAVPYKDIKAGFIGVDIQNDFCEAKLPSGDNPGLPVNKSSKIFDPINLVKSHFVNSQVYLTRDSHILGDITFASTHKVGPFTVIPVVYTLPNGTTKIQNEMVWPSHCVKGYEGYCFPKELEVSGMERIYDKGHGFRESYSAIFNTLGEQSTQLANDLKYDDVRIVFVSGLARDYCVGNTVLDLARMGFVVILLEDCTAYVAEESNNAMNEKFSKHSNIFRINSSDILDDSDINPIDRVLPKIGGARVLGDYEEKLDESEDESKDNCEDMKSDFIPIGGGYYRP